MFKDFDPVINPGDNVIVALGDSFTQGVGAYSAASWAHALAANKGNGLFNLTGEHFRAEQAKNNWASQLRDRHFPNYKVWNLGINGAGNRATVKELYLNPLPENLGNVIVIIMATGLERFDFLKNGKETGGLYNHQKWQTIWPVIGARGDISVIEKVYLRLLYSERVVTTEFLLNIAEAQHFCKAKGYKFLFSSVFDTRITKPRLTKLLSDDAHYIDIVDWNDFFKPKDDDTFMEMMCRLENSPDFNSFGKLCDNAASIQFSNLKYITRCNHWTIKRQSIVANTLADEIKERGLV